MEKNDTAAQVFKIWKIGNKPNKAVVTSNSCTYKENSNITFKWDETGFATSFWIDIWCDGKGIKSFGLNDTKYTFQNVKAGKYTIFVTSMNSNGSKVSDGYNVYVGANLGTNFQSIILRKDIWKPIEVVNGDNVKIGEENGNANERWKFDRQADGSYIIINLDNNKVLDVDNWGKSGTNVQVYTKGKTLQSNQQWYICPSFGGYIFVPKHGSGIVMDCSSGSSAKGTNIQVWVDNETKAQIFSIYKVKDSVFGTTPYVNKGNIFYAAIINMKYWAGLTVDSNTLKNDKNKNNVCFTKQENIYTKWLFKRNKNGSYSILSCLNGKALEVANTQERANIQVGNYTGKSNQQWYIFGKSGDYYLRTPCSRYVLDMSGGVYTKGVNAQTFRYQKNNIAQQCQIWLYDK